MTSPRRSAIRWTGACLSTGGTRFTQGIPHMETGACCLQSLFHSLRAARTGSMPVDFHQLRSSPVRCSSRWWVRQSGTTNSSLALRPSATGRDRSCDLRRWQMPGFRFPAAKWEPRRQRLRDHAAGRSDWSEPCQILRGPGCAERRDPALCSHFAVGSHGSSRHFFRIKCTPRQRHRLMPGARRDRRPAAAVRFRSMRRSDVFHTRQAIFLQSRVRPLLGQNTAPQSKFALSSCFANSSST